MGAKNLKVNLQVLSFVEDEVHYAYIPALDLIGYGNSEQDSFDSLNVVLSEFFQYTNNKSTFNAELERLGWHKKRKHYHAPTISEQVLENEQLRDILNHKHYSARNLDIPIPSFA